jgi:methionine synthase I (cobalamin-dependent)
MTSDPLAALAPRLASGRPLLLGGDVGASLRGVGLGPGAGGLGKLVREHPGEVDRHYRVEIEAGVDVLTTLTAETTPRVLAQVGMAFRSSAITSLAVDLALAAAERAGRAVAVAGVLGGSSLSPLDVTTLVEEHGQQAARMAAAGVDLILARGMASQTELMAAVVAAASTGLPTWAVVEANEGGTVLSGERASKVVAALEAAGAAAVLFEAPLPTTLHDALQQCHEGRHQEAAMPLGALLAAGPASIEGFPDSEIDPATWAESFLSLLPLGLRIVGGGRGSTWSHTETLAGLLRGQPLRRFPSQRPTAGSLG